MLRISPVLAVAALVLFARPVSAAGSVDAELTAAAADIQKYLKGLGAKSVALGAIRSASDEKISHGPGMGLRLKNQLTAVGIKMDPTTRYGVVGQYEAKDDAKSKRVLIQLTLWVVDNTKAGAKLIAFPRAIYGEDALIELLAPAAIAIPPSTPDDKREDHIVRSIDELRTKPQWVIDKTVVYAGADKVYGVEFLVKDIDGKIAGRAPKADDGDLVIDLKKGETFRIRLVNKSKYELAATVQIDGLNTFSFGAFEKLDEKPRWLVAAGKEADIAGWPTGDGKSREFLVTDYAGSAVAELGGDKAKLGVLTVVFAACWPKKGAAPADEPSLDGSKGSTGVGRGAEIDTPLEKVERTFGRTRASISLRYGKD